MSVVANADERQAAISSDGALSPLRYISGGTILLPLRLIVGWTYFSAFWRRLILENKLDPDGPGYIGEKFNHFLPNALFIKPQIEFFVSNPDLLWWKLLAFTIVEAIVGGLLMLGFMTRAMGIATSLLALGILLGAGWLGTTCLDEWQIGILGIGSGIAFAWAGGGHYSLDRLFCQKWDLSGSRLKQWLFAPDFQFGALGTKILLIAGTLAFGMTLYTNQVFHNGLWGPLKNMSVKPYVEISQAKLNSDRLELELFRTEGADVYGSFLIEVQVIDSEDNVVAAWDADKLSSLPADAITNRYVAKIKPGPHSLILPLGAKGTITLQDPKLSESQQGEHTETGLRVVLVDISGAKWQAPIEKVKS